MADVANGRKINSHMRYYLKKYISFAYGAENFLCIPQRETNLAK
jgi:hypothetical protein